MGQISKWWLAVLVLLFSGAAFAGSVGELTVQGQAGKFQLFQKVKAVRCEVGKRGACDPAVFFDLNTPQTLPVGNYLVGFENTIYPNVVKIQTGKAVVLKLETVKVPSRVRGGKIRVYRDFSSKVEQNKILLTMFVMNRHFFRLDSTNFGDWYLTGAWERDVVQRFTYEFCGKLNSVGSVKPSARAICNSWNSAKSPAGLKELFSFSEEGTFTENWVTFPGDVIPSRHSKYLVSAPMGEQDMVAVFPGVYQFQSDTKNAKAISVNVGTLP